MTLSPVFRSAEDAALLKSKSVWPLFEPSLARQESAVRAIRRDLKHVLNADFVQSDAPADPDRLAFLQEFFFLVLFDAVLETIGVESDRLRYYAELNFCIKGTITAGDNLFDDQDKLLLPLKLTVGQRYQSIVQLICFERLCTRIQGRFADTVTPAEHARCIQEVFSAMTHIGALEGSEEGGTSSVPEPAAMIENVHRIRGGALFRLGFVAPMHLEQGDVRVRVREAAEAIAQLGTCFQIVDDLTDFETDLSRGSHNILVSEITYHGSRGEKEALARMRKRGAPPRAVEQELVESASRVFEVACQEAVASFARLAKLGLVFPETLVPNLVRGIVGFGGADRMAAVAEAARG